MAEFRRSSKDNYLEIFEGFHSGYFKNSYESIPVQDTNMEFIKDKKRIRGIKLNSFFEKNEIAGNFAEQEFSRLLKNKKFFSVFFGPKYEMHEDSKGFDLDITKDKPDFLVNIPGIGQVFIDVKCRRLLGKNKNNDDQTYALLKNEIENLYYIEKGTNIPVWFAFIDYDTFDFNKSYFNKGSFKIIPLKVVLDFINKLKRPLKEEFKTLFSFKIPLEIFSQGMPFESLILKPNISSKLVKKWVHNNLESLKELRRMVKTVVDSGDYYKNYLPYNFFNSEIYKSEENLIKNYFTPQDVSSILWSLIHKGEIIHKKGEYLRLNKNDN